MKRYLILSLIFLAACASIVTHPTTGLILYAQSLPSVKHAVWTPDAASFNVTNYVVTIDGVAQNVAPGVCTPTQCSAAVSVTSFGSHTVTVVAQNLALSTDPTSTQSSAAASVTFTLNQAAPSVSGASITN